MAKYRIALKPVADQLVVELITLIKYGIITRTNVLDSTLDEDKKFEEAKVKHHANKFNALISAGFTRDEAMSILLIEISKPTMKLDQLPSIKFGKKKKSEEK